MKKSLLLFLSVYCGLSPIYANEQLTINIQNQNLELVKCQAGFFYMGSSTDETGRNNDNELKQFKTSIEKDFYIGKYETTQAIYQTVMGINPAKNKEPNNPVEQVSFYDALKFCDKLNEMTESLRPHGYKFSLPTEKQWEFACRAGMNTSLNNGMNISNTTGKSNELDGISWYKGNSDVQTHEVGTKKPNLWGIYDMHGNTAEWCLDAFNGDSLAETINDNSKCIVRGGSYFYEPENLRSASREKNSPNYTSSDLGFRVALVSNDTYISPQIDKNVLEKNNVELVSQSITKDNTDIQVKVAEQVETAEPAKAEEPVETAEPAKVAEPAKATEPASQTNEIKNTVSEASEALEVPTEKIVPPAIIPTTDNSSDSVKPQKPEFKAEIPSEPTKVKTFKELTIKAGEKISISYNGVKFPLIGCPAGDFLMGSPNNETGHKEDEVQHKVTISKGFYIGKYEITQGQYHSIMGSNPSTTVGSKLPVHNLNYIDAKNFCQKLNELTKDKRPEGYEFDIPTEEEWEYACRSNYKTSLNNGTNLNNADSSDNELNKIAWYSANSCEKVQTVGKRTANAWGIHDMLGNIWEWCKKTEPDNKTKAVIRGGSFKSNASDCRNAFRKEIESNKTNEDYGFRIVLKPAF